MSDEVIVEAPKRGRGRPKIDPLAERQKVREALWTPGLRPVHSGTSGLPEVWLPNPPGKKGTSQYAAWSKECFLELLRHGYNYSQASTKLGYEGYKWWALNSTRDPVWAEEARQITSGGDFTGDDSPDLSQMPFDEFVRLYFGYELAEHQREIVAALEDPLAKTCLILGHPEAGKSTLVSLWYVLYRLAKNQDIRIALVSKSSQKAQDLLTRVKRYLTEDHLYDDAPRNLIADFHGWKPVHGDFEWSQDQIFIRQRKSGERDPTIQALGIGKQIYGSRIDLLILDDALVLDNQITEGNRSRIDQWFTNEAQSRARRGQTVVNGTRLFPHDLYGQWKKSWTGKRLFRGVFIPAILDEFTEKERVTWPEYWTLDGYDIMEEVNGTQHVVGHNPGMRDIRDEISARDPARWKLVYQQQDIEELENVFTQRHIDAALALGAGRKIGKVFDHEILILGVDPATTGRAASVLIALDPETRVRMVIDIFVSANLGATGIKNDLLYRFWEKYVDHRVQFSVIETNFVPTLMADDSLRNRADAMGTQLVDHRTIGRGRRRGSIHDEEYGIGALSSLFGGGLIGFANADMEDKVKLQPLLDDMLVFPWADQKDALVALWVANGEASIAHNIKIDQVSVARNRNLPPYVSDYARQAVASRNVVARLR